MAVVDSSGTFRVGEWVVEPALGLVRRGEEAVHVTPRAMAVLLHLARAEGAVVARNEILDAIWPRMDVTQDALSQCIVELRKAFHDDSKSPEVIETIPRRGVRLIAPVAAAQATNGIAEEAAHEEKEIGGARKQKLGPTSRVFAPRRLAAMVLVIGGAALGAFWLAEHRAPEAIGTNEELARLSEFPGTSARARAYYLRGNELFKRSNYRLDDLTLAVEQYKRATQADPDFALAWARLSVANMALYFYGVDRTPARLEEAEHAFQRAFEIVPDLPEARVARANYLYRGFGRTDEVLAEFALAEESNPRDSLLYFLRSSVYRRVGDWDRAIRDLDRAIELDPLNFVYLRQQHINYLSLRDYARAEEYLDRILEFAEDDATTYVDKVMLALYREGNTALANWYDETPPTRRYAEGLSYDETRWLAAIYDRDFGKALRVLDSIDEDWVRRQNSRKSKALLYARTYRLAGDVERAGAHFERAVDQINEEIESGAQSDGIPDAFLELAEAEAGLGHTRNALEWLERARGPSQPSPRPGQPSRSDLPLGAALNVLLPLGETAEALEELDAYMNAPGSWSIEGLAKDPRLEPLRADPRFVDLGKRYARN